MKRYFVYSILAISLLSACQKQDETRTQCEQGNFNSCYAYGLKFSRGTGVKRNINKALNYFEKACNGGYADGCGYLATMYGLGDGVKMNQATAKKYYGKACELGHKESCATYQKMTQMGVK